MNKILLTGGSGFIGENILEHYSNQKLYSISAPSRSEMLLTDNKSVDNYFDGKEYDCLLNAAAVGSLRGTINNDASCIAENLKIFRNIFQHRDKCKRFIQFGSGAEYSKPFYKPNMTENDVGNLIPMDAYGMAKFFSGQVLESLGNVGQSVNLRIFGVFGSGEDYRIRFISNAIVRSLFDLPIIVNQNAEFDYVYIDDFIKILDYFIQNSAPYISYNITTGISIALVELAEIVKKVTNNSHKIIIKNKEIKESYTGDNSRLREFLPGSFVFTPIEIAIKELTDWYINNINVLDKTAILTQSE